MPHYAYSAIDDKRKKYAGNMEAANTGQLAAKLREKNQFIIKANDLADVASGKAIGQNRKVSIKSLAVFCRQFATLINAGITAVKSLDILYEQTEDKGLKVYLGRIYEAVQKGEAMSEAFRKQGVAFPELFTNMVLAGEGSGNLDSVLVRMADHYEKENKIKNKIKAAMIYPAVLMTLTILVVILMLTVVLPVFTGLIMSGGGEVPLPTRILLGLSDVLRQYWYLILGFIILFTISWRSFKRSEKGRLWWDTVKLKVPVVKKSLRMIYSARFSRTLSTLLSSGIQMLPSIEVTGKIIGNQLIHNKLKIVIEDIRKGLPLSLAIKKTEQFPSMIFNMISIGEESGNLDDILTKTAAFYDEESDSAISRLVALLEPLMIVFMALVIGFVVVSIYLPMFGMYGAAAQ